MRHTIIKMCECQKHFNIHAKRRKQLTRALSATRAGDDPDRSDEFDRSLALLAFPTPPCDVDEPDSPEEEKESMGAADGAAVICCDTDMLGPVVFVRGLAAAAEVLAEDGEYTTEPLLLELPSPPLELILLLLLCALSAGLVVLRGLNDDVTPLIKKRK